MNAITRGFILVAVAGTVPTVNLMGNRLQAEQQAEEASRVSVFVEIRPTEQRQPVRNLINEWGGTVRYEYAILPNIISVRGIPEDKLLELTDHPSVAKIEPDKKVYASLLDSMPRINGLQEQITAAGFESTGAGVRLCVVDTGIRATHTMYSGRVDLDAGYDFVNNDTDPSDDNGHGSHVAGVAAGRTGLTVAFPGGGGLEPLQGVAPEVVLIDVKSLDEFGAGHASDVIAGIDHCVSPTLPGGPADVINLSLGDNINHAGACDNDPLAQAANNASAAGAVVVAASGNNGFENGMHSPACGSEVISVGSTYDDPFPNPDFPPFDSFTFCVQRSIFGTCIAECTDNFPQTDDVPCYSNGGTELDVTAPGSYIWSAVHDSDDLIVGEHGTSAASPHVAGLAALILDSSPGLSPAAVRQLIRDGSVDFGAPGFDQIYGYGRIDIVGTLNLLLGCSSDAECDDGEFCTGAETCSGGVCSSFGDPCGAQMCRESDDTCVNCLQDTDCDDGNPCNGTEMCNASGNCAGGSIVDCNSNGTDDACDLGQGTSQDCNANAIPDKCDIASGTSIDCNGNAIPDDCESDCNGNGIADECDIASGPSEDCNGNMIPDECDVFGGTSQDCNSDIIPDECQADCNDNSIPDDCDIASGASIDCNGNNIPRRLQRQHGAGRVRRLWRHFAGLQR
jgi:subtilisin family serine protease